MSKHLFTALLTTASLTGWSQALIPAGTIQVSGAVSYTWQQSESPATLYDQSSGSYLTTRQRTTNQQFYTSPAIGYFVAPNLAVGLTVASTSSKQATTYDNLYGQFTDNDLVTSSVNLGLFGQYYRFINNWFGLTTTLTGSVGSYQSHAHPYGTSYDSYGFGASLTPGLVFLPTERLAVGSSVGGLFYNRYKADGGSSRNEGFGANFGLSYLTLNGTYFFRRRS